MAKITDLVKTYRMLSDPNAPDWNVKFAGAIAVGIVLVAAGAGALYWALSDDAPGASQTTFAAEQEQPPADECAPAEGAPATPTTPALECPDAPPAVLP